jgi:hypothetical protein
MPVSITPDAIAPDAYSGSVSVRAEGLDEPVSSPFAVNVRAGPGLAAIVLIVGILMGRARKEDDRREATRPKWPAWSEGWVLRPVATVLWVFTGRRAATWPEAGQQAVFMVIAIALWSFGMATLYAANAAFGAKGFGDYLSLFLWGFGADVTLLSINKR